MTLDDKALCGGQTVHLRRAPGTTHYDFGQVGAHYHSPFYRLLNGLMLSYLREYQNIFDLVLHFMILGEVIKH